jgi:simple sugar transport system permease protein
VLVAATFLIARHSVIARHLKVAGEHPQALTTAGVSVPTMRVIAQVWCFALCALAGAQLSLGQLTLFTEGMTSGLGFVALAVVIFSQGRVMLLAGMSFVFGLSTAVSVQVDSSIMPPQFAQMLPYVVALLGLIVLSRSATASPLRIARPVLND